MVLTNISLPAWRDSWAPFCVLKDGTNCTSSGQGAKEMAGLSHCCFQELETPAYAKTEWERGMGSYYMQII